MRSLHIFFLSFFILFTNVQMIDASIPINGSFSEIIEKASPAVVNISTTQVVSTRQGIFDERSMEFFDLLDKYSDIIPEKKRKAKSLGSGFLISSDGYIVTNYHVVDEAEDIEITLSNENEKTYKGKVIGKDRKADLAILKIEVDKQLPYLQFADSDKARVGDFIVTIGSPFGLSSTVTSGIISAKGRYLPGLPEEYIQTDASINRGNSGGPMLNIAGEVIGINTVIISPSGGSVGIGFAIPSSSAIPIIEKLKTGKPVIRGFIGITIQQVNEEVAKTMGLSNAGGALVASVIPGSPSANAGIQAGDIITKFNGKSIQSTNKFTQAVAATPIDSVIDIEVFRSGSYKNLKVKIAKAPQDDEDNIDKQDGNDDKISKQDKDELKILGMKLKGMSEGLRRNYKVPDGINGVLVTNVDSDGVASDAKIKRGDVIVQINQDKILSTQDFSDKIEMLRKQKHDTAALLIANSFGAYFVIIKINERN